MNNLAESHPAPRTCSGSLRFLLAGVMFIGMGIVLGAVATRPSTAWGEVRTPPPPQHFQSGSQLSLPMLQEISATLRQIDARLARLEAVAQKMQMKHVRASAQ